MESAQLPVINAFWFGPMMGPLHAACLQSFARQGHRVVLHTYDPPQDCPKGVELADASILMSRHKVVPHKRTGSYSLPADMFRLELQAAGAGIYVDCDCYCVRPLDDEDIVFGRANDAGLNTSVLKLPADSPILEAMRSIATTRGFVPPWGAPARQIWQHVRKTLGAPVELPDLKWGVMGPSALTYYANQLGIFDQAKPSDFFYPVGVDQIKLLRDPGLEIKDLITPRTRVVHLWNEMLKHSGEPLVPQGSPLAEVIGSLDTR